MKDYFYRFVDEQDMLVKLEPLGMTYTNEEGVVCLSEGSHQYAAWPVGEIMGYDGYHLNVRKIDMEMDLSSLIPNEVYPVAPKCIWA